MVWLLLAAAFGLGGLSVFGLILGALDAEAVAAAASGGALPDGPRRLVDEVRFTFVIAGALMVLALALLYGARLAFHRPAWTFIGPAAPFRARLFALGFVLFGALVVADQSSSAPCADSRSTRRCWRPPTRSTSD
jgi:uncharacterized BrkB/YihY/UPF0761 family membrane protein